MREYVLAAVAVVLATFAVCNSHAQPSNVSPAQEIRWEVNQRFRLLDSGENERLQAIWETVERSSPPGTASAQALLLALEKSRQPGQAMINPRRATGYGRETGRYTRSYVDIRAQTVKVKVWPSVSGMTSCAWQAESPARVEITATDCSALIAVPYGESVLVTLTSGAGGTVAKTEVRVNDVLVVAYGDSYASGEGNPDIPAQYGLSAPATNQWLFINTRLKHEPAYWLDQECHRSLLSWPMLAALKMALADKHRTVTLLDYACSGAEVVDGVMKAQFKGPLYARNKAGPRDGDDPGNQKNVQSVRRSQANALREDLCGAEPIKADVIKEVPGPEHARAWMVTCDSPARKPDFLILTIGGNDIKFGPTVQGILMPSKAQGKKFGGRWIRQKVLDLVREKIGIVPVADLGKRAKDAISYYPKVMELIAESAWVPAENVVLVRYPNPVNDGSVDITGCIGPDVATHHKNSYMAFGVTAHELDSRVPLGWTIDFTASEMNDFVKAFPNIQAMQKSACASRVRVIDALSARTSPAFSDRLICSPMSKERREELEPRYFCQGNDCGAPAKPMSTWNPYRPGLRMTYSLNDALLTQRSWRNCPNGARCSFDDHIKEALSGTMHLTAEMHAAIADSVVDALVLTGPTAVCN